MKRKRTYRSNKKEFIRFFDRRYPYSQDFVDYKDRYTLIPAQGYDEVGGFIPDLCLSGWQPLRKGYIQWEHTQAVHYHPTLQNALGYYPAFKFNDQGEVIEKHAKRHCWSERMDMAHRNLTHFRYPSKTVPHNYDHYSNGSVEFAVILAIPPAKLIEVFGDSTFINKCTRRQRRYVFFDPLCLGIYIHLWDDRSVAEEVFEDETMKTIFSKPEAFTYSKMALWTLTKDWPFLLTARMDARYLVGESSTANVKNLEIWLNNYLATFSKWLLAKLDNNIVVGQAKLCSFESELRYNTSLIFEGYTPRPLPQMTVPQLS